MQAGYGLTLVAGLPLPEAVTAAACAARCSLETVLPRDFIWYASSHLHVTVRALLRTRYRPAPPLRQAELPLDLAAFAADLAVAVALERPLRMEFGPPQLSPHGALYASVTASLSRGWWDLLDRYQELDREAPRAEFHVTLGYAADILAGSPRTAGQIGSDLAAYTGRLDPLGVCEVSHLWLVHYAERTLARVVGRLELPLGHRLVLTPAMLLSALTIGD